MHEDQWHDPPESELLHQLREFNDIHELGSISLKRSPILQFKLELRSADLPRFRSPIAYGMEFVIGKVSELILIDFLRLVRKVIVLIPGNP